MLIRRPKRKPRRSPETDLVKACLEYLRRVGIFAWRNNTRNIKVDGRLLKFGLPGSSDILGVYRDGRFLAIECKISPNDCSALQREFLARVSEAGGIAWVVRDHLDDLIRQLLDLEK